MNFLGLLDISQKSLILALLAGVSQFFQAYYMPKPAPSAAVDGKASFQESFSKSMQVQMRYVFPVLITFIAYNVSGAIALYWIVSNAMAIGQQVYLKSKKITVVAEK